MFWQPAATMAAAAIERKARFEARVVFIALHPIVVGERGFAAPRVDQRQRYRPRRGAAFPNVTLAKSITR
jgi:hypothetical protein